MSFLLALLLLFPHISQTELTAYSTWDQMRWEYDLPPISLHFDTQGGTAIALQGGFDAEGRAVVVFDPILRTYSVHDVQKTSLHEAVHAMLRYHGVEYSGLHEEQLANGFAYCTLEEPGYIPSIDGETLTCGEVLERLRPYHR